MQHVVVNSARVLSKVADSANNMRIWASFLTESLVEFSSCLSRFWGLIYVFPANIIILVLIMFTNTVFVDDFT